MSENTAEEKKMCRRCKTREAVKGFDLCSVCPSDEVSEKYNTFLDSLSPEQLSLHNDFYGAISMHFKIRAFMVKNAGH